MERDKALTYYLDKKLKNEMSLADIRQELEEKEGFTKDEAKQLSREISERELNTVSKTHKSFASVVNHKAFSYLMIAISLGICIYSVLKLIKVVELSDQYEVPPHYYFIPALFIVASIIFIIKHILTLRKR